MPQNCPEYSDFCSTVVCQTADVSVPICLTPCVDVGNAKIRCCCEPSINFCQPVCGNGCLEIKINQTIACEIPVEYRVELNTGEISAECKKTTNCNCTTDSTSCYYE